MLNRPTVAINQVDQLRRQGEIRRQHQGLFVKRVIKDMDGKGRVVRIDFALGGVR